jgi:thymidine phosphorylase
VEVLSGRGPADVRALTLDLAAEMLLVSGAEASTDAGRERATHALDSGAAMEKFLALVEAQGGDPGRVERAGLLPKAPVVTACTARAGGVVRGIDTFALGDLVVDIGGGRRSKEDSVDPRVGLLVRVRIGDRVEAGDMLAELHLSGSDAAAQSRVEGCFDIGPGATDAPALILERIGEV